MFMADPRIGSGVQSRVQFYETLRTKTQEVTTKSLGGESHTITTGKKLPEISSSVKSVSTVKSRDTLHLGQLSPPLSTQLTNSSSTKLLNSGESSRTQDDNTSLPNTNTGQSTVTQENNTPTPLPNTNTDESTGTQVTNSLVEKPKVNSEEVTAKKMPNSIVKHEETLPPEVHHTAHETGTAAFTALEKFLSIFSKTKAKERQSQRLDGMAKKVMHHIRNGEPDKAGKVLANLALLSPSRFQEQLQKLKTDQTQDLSVIGHDGGKVTDNYSKTLHAAHDSVIQKFEGYFAKGNMEKAEKQIALLYGMGSSKISETTRGILECGNSDKIQLLNKFSEKLVLSYHQALDSKDSTKAADILGQLQNIDPELAKKEKIEGEARQYRLAAAGTNDQKAQVHLENLSKLDPDKALKEETKMVQEKFRRAIDKGDEKAPELLKKLTELNPEIAKEENERALGNLSAGVRNGIKDGKLEQAEKYTKLLEKMDSTRVGPAKLEGLAMKYESLPNKDEGKEILNQIRNIDPKRANDVEFKGLENSYREALRQGKTEEANVIFLKMTTLDSKEAGKTYSITLSESYRSLMLAGDSEKGAKVLEELQKHDPASAQQTKVSVAHDLQVKDMTTKLQGVTGGLKVKVNQFNDAIKNGETQKAETLRKEIIQGLSGKEISLFDEISTEKCMIIFEALVKNNPSLAGHYLAQVSRTNPRVAAEVALEAKYDSTGSDKIADSIIDQLTPEEAKKFLFEINKKCVTQNDTPETFFRGNSFESRLYSTFGKRHIIPQFSERLKPFFESIQSDRIIKEPSDPNDVAGRIQWEKDVQLIREKTEEVLGIFQDLYSKNKTAEFQAYKDAVENLYKHASEKFGEKPALIPVRNQHFLRRDIPIITAPSINIGTLLPTREQQSLLTFIGKLAQNSANEILMSKKESGLEMLDPGIQKLKSNFDAMTQVLMPKATNPMFSQATRKLVADQRDKWSPMAVFENKALFNLMKAHFSLSNENFLYMEAAVPALEISDPGAFKVELQHIYDKFLDTQAQTGFGFDELPDPNLKGLNIHSSFNEGIKALLSKEPFKAEDMDEGKKMLKSIITSDKGINHENSWNTYIADEFKALYKV